MRKKILMLMLGTILIASCSDSSNRVGELTKELGLYKDSLKTARAEITRYQTIPAVLLEKAQVFYKVNKLDQLDSILSLAIKYHPETDETSEIRELKRSLVKELNKK